MYWKAAKAVRRKVSWLVKGKLSQDISVRDSTVVEDILLYWTRDVSEGRPLSTVTGYGTGYGGIGKGLFSVWKTDGRWEIELKDICPTALARELEDFIEEVNGEEEKVQG